MARQPGAAGDLGEELPLSRPLREQISAAAEHLVGLLAVPASALGNSGST